MSAMPGIGARLPLSGKQSRDASATGAGRAPMIVYDMGERRMRPPTNARLLTNLNPMIDARICVRRCRKFQASGADTPSLIWVAITVGALVYVLIGLRSLMTLLSRS